jgi:membrane-bound lytic murein transglycosylase B
MPTRGIETGFGAYTGDIPVFQTLAIGLFRAQLFDALTMVDAGHIDAPSMKGSWAGAMGQAQFMPSSYLAYAVDFDDDGRRDIWTSHTDTFASIANCLKGHGWRGDEPWGFEVRVSLQLRASLRAGRSDPRGSDRRRVDGSEAR